MAVLPAAVSPRHSSLGPLAPAGLDPALGLVPAVAGSPARFVLEPLDAFGNLANTSGAAFSIQLLEDLPGAWNLTANVTALQVSDTLDPVAMPPWQA